MSTKPKLGSVLRWIFCLLVGAVLLHRFVLSFEPGQDRIPQDFGIFHQAAQLIDDGQNPYRATERHSFKYSPGALMFIQFLPDDPHRAWTGFAVLSIFFFILGIGLLRGGTGSIWEPLWIIIGMILSWKGIIEAMDYGQTELLFLGLVSIGFFFIHRPWLLGSVAGLLFLIKIPFGLLLVPAIASRPEKWKSTLGGFTIVVFGIGLFWPLIQWGYERTFYLTLSWVELIASQPPFLYPDSYNQSFFGSLLRVFLGFPRGEVNQYSVQIASLAFGMAWIAGGFLLFKVIQKSQTCRDLPSLGLASLWLVSTQLVNPLGWRWGSLFLVGLPLLFGKLEKKKQIAAVIVLFVLFLIQQNPLVRKLGFYHWTDLHRFGTITWFWLTALVLALWGRTKSHLA